jgi:tetrahydromethanopterin S-methyltransferase subunit H
MKRGVLSDKAEKKFIEIFSECAIKYLDTNTESIVLDQIKHSENVPHAQKVNYNELSDDIKGIVQKKLKAENLTLYDSCTNGIQVWVYSSPENYTEAKNNKLISIIADSLKTSVFKTKNEQRKLMDTFAMAVGSGSVATIRTAVTKHIEVELKRVNAETLTAITSLIPLDASSIKINTKEDNGKTTLIIDYVVDCGIANVK